MLVVALCIAASNITAGVGSTFVVGTEPQGNTFVFEGATSESDIDLRSKVVSASSVAAAIPEFPVQVCFEGFAASFVVTLENGIDARAVFVTSTSVVSMPQPTIVSIGNQ